MKLLLLFLLLFLVCTISQLGAGGFTAKEQLLGAVARKVAPAHVNKRTPTAGGQQRLRKDDDDDGGDYCDRDDRDDCDGDDGGDQDADDDNGRDCDRDGRDDDCDDKVRT